MINLLSLDLCIGVSYYRWRKKGQCRIDPWFIKRASKDVKYTFSKLLYDETVFNRYTKVEVCGMKEGRLREGSLIKNGKEFTI
jgi:hypothetical protein